MRTNEYIIYLEVSNIENKVYLYREIVEKLKHSYIEDIVINVKGSKNKERKSILYMLYPNIRENEQVYLKLFKDKAEYIYINSYDILKLNEKRCVRGVKMSDGTIIDILLKKDMPQEAIKYICYCIAISLADYVVVGKVCNIPEGIKQLDIALDFGKEIYAFPGEIFNYKNYLSNFAIKQGAIPICTVYDVNNIK